MTSYPVLFSVTRPARYLRAELGLRVVLLAVLSIVGITMGAVFGLLYLGLPLAVAVALHRRGPRRFLAEDAPRIARAIHWVMSFYAYLALVTDRFPDHDDGVGFEIEPGAWTAGGSGPTMAGALWRLVYSLPSALFLAVLGLASWAVWLVAAVMILLTEDYPAGLHAFQCGVLRFQARLLAYHASLVEAHPPYALDVDDVERPGPEPLAH